MRKRIAAGILAGTFLLAACGGGSAGPGGTTAPGGATSSAGISSPAPTDAPDSGSAPDPASSTDSGSAATGAPPAAPSGTDLGSLLLTIADAPAGWSVNSAEPKQLPYACIAGANPTVGDADKVRAAFSGGSGGDALSETIARYPSADDASAALSASFGSLSGCDQTAGIGGAQLRFIATQMSYPDTGDESRAIAASVTQGGSTAAGAMYLIARHENLVVWVVLSRDNMSPIVSDLTAWVDAAMARVAG
jgi:hypothetical protein